MSRSLSILLVGVAVILIVGGRLNHGVRWGNRVAVAGFAVVALAGALALATR